MGIEKGTLKSDVRERAEKAARERLESNPEYQRRKLMTKEEKGRDAVNRLTKLTKDFAERNGKQMTESQARAFAEKMQSQNRREAGE